MYGWPCHLKVSLAAAVYATSRTAGRIDRGSMRSSDEHGFEIAYMVQSNRMRYTTTALRQHSAHALLGAALLVTTLTLLPTPPAAAETLSVERIFAAPDLSGPRLRQPKFSPDGRYVTYLQGKPENKDQLDLWGFDTRSGKAKLLVDSKAFNVSERLSAEEEARRERQRTASLSGIVDYEFSADGKKLLVPLGGDLYLYNLNARGDNAVRRLTYTAGYETDARLSPEGRYVSFIRDQNLYLIDLTTYQERALTSDGAGLIQNGVAEFVAQEEMDRDTGYWWSPDEKRIAFTRIDDSPVAEIERFEINADGAKAVRQRYPAAGTPNTRVELKVLDLTTRRVINVDLGLQDGYLARVNWFPDSRRLAVQRQTRDQKQLDLLRVDAASGATKVLITETSKHWIDMHKELQILRQREAFVWGSRRNGYKHLYLYDFEG
jgi:dipeptidyl-peptidase-4